MSDIKYELEGNFALEKAFRDNPGLKYLPIAARERGMYGAFVKGNLCLYFVFGYDEELIMRGKFIDLECGLFSEDEYFAEHRIGIHGQAVRRLRYNAFPVRGGHLTFGDIGLIIEFMNDLERIVAIAKRFNIKLTEYFHYSTAFNASVRRYYAQLSTARDARETARLEKEMLHLFSMSMMTSENPRPEDKGLTIEDYRTSAYCVDSDPRMVEKMFRNPAKWEDHLFGYTKDFADNSALVCKNVNIGIMNALEYILKQHHVPYRITENTTRSPRLMRSLEDMDFGSKKIREGDSVILVFPALYSVSMDFLERWAYINSWFTNKEKQEAYRLFQSGQFYGFTIPLYSPLIYFMRGRGVKLCAHELLQYGSHSGAMDCYCMVPLSQKPLVDEVLLEFTASDAYAHDQSTTDFYAASEMRIPRWEGGHQVAICHQGNQAGTIDRDGSVIMKNYYDSKIDSVPDEELQENGHLIEEPYLVATDLNTTGTEYLSDEAKEQLQKEDTVPGTCRRCYESWGDV